MATQSTQPLSSSTTLRLVFRQYLVKMQSERLMRKGWGTSKIAVIVYMFMGMCVISMDLMVFIEVSDEDWLLPISCWSNISIYSSAIRIDIFLLILLLTESGFISFAVATLASASKQILDPPTIFLKERNLSFLCSLAILERVLEYLLKCFWA